MSHSLNEIKVRIDTGSTSDNFDALVQKIVDLTGWEAVNTTYKSRTKEVTFCCNTNAGEVTSDTIGINLSLASNNYIYTNILHGSSTYNENSWNAGTNSTFYLYLHKSTNETVTYLNFFGKEYMTYLYALDNNNQPALFNCYTYSGNDYTKLIYTTLTIGNSYLNLPGIESGVNCSITKVPSARTNSFFPELYYVISNNFMNPDNALVNFDDSIYRIAMMYRNTSYYWCGAFAFPVSDPA